MNTVQVKRYEMGRNGGLVEIDTAKVANLPVGTVLHWGGNMGSPERDVCIVGVRPIFGRMEHRMERRTDFLRYVSYRKGV